MSPDTGGRDGAMIKYRNIHRLINGYKKGLVCRTKIYGNSVICCLLGAGGCLTEYFNEKEILRRKVLKEENAEPLSLLHGIMFH